MTRLSPVPPPLIQVGRGVGLWLQQLADRATSTASPVADLNQVISDTPSKAEVQELTDKVDELLAALRAAGLMES